MEKKVTAGTEIDDEKYVGEALESRVASLHKRGWIDPGHCLNLKGEANTGFPVKYAFLRDDFHREPFARHFVLDFDDIGETSLPETFDDDQGFGVDTRAIDWKLLCCSIRRVQNQQRRRR